MTADNSRVATVQEKKEQNGLCYFFQNGSCQNTETTCPRAHLLPLDDAEAKAIVKKFQIGNGGLGSPGTKGKGKGKGGDLGNVIRGACFHYGRTGVCPKQANGEVCTYAHIEPETMEKLKINYAQAQAIRDQGAANEPAVDGQAQAARQ